MTLPLSRPLRVHAVIVNYATPQHTLRAVAATRIALDRLVGRNGGAGFVTVVDNASPDGSAALLEGEFAGRGWDRRAPCVELVRAGGNVGFGAGNNLGFGRPMPDGGRADLFWCVNPDARPRPDALVAMVDALRADPQAGLAGSFLEGEDGVPHRTAFRFPSVAGEFEDHARIGLISRLLAAHRMAPQLPAATQRMDWVAGASLLIRREVLDRTGGFDPGFFLYFEEVDLCRRALAAGWHTLWVRKSEVVHEGSAATGMKRWQRMPGYWFDSRTRYWLKAHGRAGLAAATLAALAGHGLGTLHARLRGRGRLRPRGYLRGLAGSTLDGLARGLGATVAWRSTAARSLAAGEVKG